MCRVYECYVLRILWLSTVDGSVKSHDALPADSAEVNPATLPQYHISGDAHLNLNDITSGVIDLGNNNGNGISDDDAKQ